MKRIFTLILFLLSLSSFANNSENTIVINDSLIQLNLNKYTYTYSSADTSSAITPILGKEFSYDPSGLNLGMNDKIHWIKYDIVNPSDIVKEYYLLFPYNHINKIIVYGLYDNEAYYIKSTGTFFNYRNKDISSRSYPILLKLKPGKTSIYIYIKHLNLPLRASSFLVTENVVRVNDKKTETGLWFWKGIFSFALLITFVLYLTTKLKPFLYYMYLNIGVGLFFAAEIGDFFTLFDSDPYNSIIDIKHLGNWIALFASPLFVNSMFPIAKLSPKIWKAMFVMLSVLPIFWLINLFPAVKNTIFLYYTTYYLIIASIVVFLLMIYFTLIAYLHIKNYSALGLFIAYVFYITATVINITLPNLGLTNSNLDVYSTFIYGSVFEIVVFMGLLGKETLSVYRDRAILLESQKNHQIEIIKAIVESQEQARNKIGRELHDMIGANISVIKQQVDKKNRSLINIIDRTIDSVRTLSHGLVTPLIKDDDFTDEITDLCIASSDLDIKVRSHFHNWSKIENAETATHLYRIIQELLQNAIKHSNAKQILIQFIVNKENNLTVMYEDDGIGFDYKKSYNRKGLGLINIENRIKLMGASIIYDTKEKGSGTTVIIHIGEKKMQI